MFSAILLYYILPASIIIFILFFVTKAAVKSAIDDKLVEIKKAFRDEIDSKEK